MTVNLYTPQKPHIDWVTFTVPFQPPAVDSDAALLVAAQYNAGIFQTFGETYPEIARLGVGCLDKWKVAGAVRPYPLSIVNEHASVKIGLGGQHEYATVWVSGQALKRLRSKPEYEYELNQVLAWVLDNGFNVSRCDIACDLITQASVSELAPAMILDTAAAKSHSHIVSSSGETVTLGSRKSTYYTRIYKYNNIPARPYPRIEIEVKGKSASRNLLFLAQNFDTATAFERVSKRAGVAVDGLSVDSDAPQHEGDSRIKGTAASRERWLRYQVAPALRRMVTDGEISLHALYKLITPQAIQRGELSDSE